MCGHVHASTVSHFVIPSRICTVQGFVTGGKDCKVCLWDESFKNCVKTYEIFPKSEDVGVSGGVSGTSAIRALSLGQGKILVGTKSSQVSTTLSCQAHSSQHWT